MMYQKFYSIDRALCGGIVLIDIVVAFSLSLLFVVVIFDMSHSARDIYDKAHEQNTAIDEYLRYEDREAGAVTEYSRPFGNTFRENIINAHGITADIDFYKISSTGVHDAQSLCSPYIAKNRIVGSYEYMKDTFDANIIHGLNVRLKAIILPIDPSLPLTDIVVRNGFAYISADSNISSDPDIFVYDIRNADNAIFISSLNTGPGIASIKFNGKKIYAAARSSAYQLHIISLDKDRHMTLQNRYRLPLPYATATPAMASAIFIGENRAYIGTEKWDGDEFDIVEIGDANGPYKVGGYDADTKINDIFVENGIAYVADSDNKQMRVLNVADPNNIGEINAVSPSGWQRQEGKVVRRYEGSTILGRTSGGFDIATDPELLYWSSSTPLSVVPPKQNVKGGVYGTVLDRDALFLATRSIDEELEITNKDMMASTTVALPIQVQNIACDNDRLFILAHSAPAIYEISFD
ncbi:MAG: hypothetical protein M1459_02850 [Patescibacteria group bacterium]|nr:hypothetical protein [Patescibacteria group bacterium]